MHVVRGMPCVSHRCRDVGIQVTASQHPEHVGPASKVWSSSAWWYKRAASFSRFRATRRAVIGDTPEFPKQCTVGGGGFVHGIVTTTWLWACVTSDKVTTIGCGPSPSHPVLHEH